MFQHTVDRAADVTGLSKTVVAGRTHEPEVRAQLLRDFDRTQHESSRVLRKQQDVAVCSVPVGYSRNE